MNKQHSLGGDAQLLSNFGNRRAGIIHEARGAQHQSGVFATFNDGAKSLYIFNGLEGLAGCGQQIVDHHIAHVVARGRIFLPRITQADD